MDNQLSRWIHAVRNLPVTTDEARRLKWLYSALLRYICTRGWQGACHATTAVLASLLRHSGYTADPVIGECFVNGYYFDHSWVEIDGLIYDAAIAVPLLPDRRLPPVYASKSVDTLQDTPVKYSCASGVGYDPEAAEILRVGLVPFMDAFPHHERGLWGVAEEVSRLARNTITATDLRESCHTLSFREARTEAT